MITTGHLCSGYDGLGMGLTAAGVGHRALWHAEVDDVAGVVLAREYPSVPNVGDLTADIWHMAPHVDLLTMGFPCQPVSEAGRGRGDADHRWLWPSCFSVIKSVRPSRVFVENVQRLATFDHGRLFRGILDDLRAAGYAVRWTILGACAVGAPHHRHRVFVVADRVGAYGPDPVRVESRTICGAPRNGGRFLLPSPAARDGDGRGEGSPEFWSRRSARRDNGMPLGAAVSLLPSPRSPSDERGAEPDRGARTGTGGTLTDAVVALLPTPMVGDATGGHVEPVVGGIRPSGAKRMDSLGSVSVLISERWGKYASAVALWERTTGALAPEPTEPGTRGARRLSPLLPEWMMGLPAGHLTKEANRKDALKLAGNGVVPLQAAAAYRLLTT